jgi:hypothetical protein
MSPWSAYDRATAPAHLGVLSALVAQSQAVALHAGRDLLSPDAAVEVMSDVLGAAARVES